MITIRIYEQEGTVFVDCEGHAGYAPKGQDIVCAAASCLSLALLKAVRSYFGRFCLSEVSDGVMRLSFPLSEVKSVRAEMMGAVNMFAFGASELERLYPSYVYFDSDCLPLWVRYIGTPEQTAEREKGGSI